MQNDEATRATRAEIERRLGFVPPFLAAAQPYPDVLAELWRQTESAYLDNPLPALFKEKLATLLSRYCLAPYCLFSHSASLRILGLNGVEVYELVENLASDLDTMTYPLDWNNLEHDAWRVHDSKEETAALECAVGLFLNVERERCEDHLRALVGADNLARILILIGYKRLCFDWTLAHPEIRYTNDARVVDNLAQLVAEEPRLQDLLFGAFDKFSQITALWFEQTNYKMLDSTRRHVKSQASGNEHYRALAEVSPQVMWEAEPTGQLTFLSRAWEKLTGTAGEDDLGFKWLERVRPDLQADVECQWLAHIDHKEAFELELLLRCTGSNTYRWHLGRAVPIRTTLGEIIKWAGIFVDIHDAKVALLELTRTREQLHSAVSISGVGFYDWDIVSNKVEISPQYQKDWQVDSGSSFEFVFSRIHKDDQERVRKSIMDSIANNRVYHEEYRIVRPDGSTLWIAARGMTGYGVHNNPTRFFGTSQDISEQVRAKQSIEDQRTWLDAVLNELPTPIVIVRPGTAEPLFSNRAAILIHGENLSKDAMRWGEEFHLTTPDGEKLTGARVPLMRAALGETLCDFEVLLHGSAGTRHLLFSSAVLPAMADHEAVVIIPFQDVTALKNAQQALADANLELRHESALRDRFVSALTHDLRAPIAATQMNAQLLPRKIANNPVAQKIAQRIVASMRRAENMIRDLLDANLLKAGQKIPLDIGDVHLDKILESGIAELNQIHGERVVLANDVGQVDGQWDHNGVLRVLDNLVNNAVKYGSDEGSVTVALTRRGEKVEISVHNEGAVISHEDQANLFEPYFRTAGAVQGGQKGWGLGLTLVKEIVECHGGHVRLESSKKAGTTFYVELPLHSQPN